MQQPDVVSTGVGFLEKEIICLTKMFQGLSCRNKSAHLQWRSLKLHQPIALRERECLHCRKGMNLASESLSLPVVIAYAQL